MLAGADGDCSSETSGGTRLGTTGLEQLLVEDNKQARTQDKYSMSFSIMLL